MASLASVRYVWESDIPLLSLAIRERSGWIMPQPLFDIIAAFFLFVPLPRMRLLAKDCRGDWFPAHVMHSIVSDHKGVQARVHFLRFRTRNDEDVPWDVEHVAPVPRPIRNEDISGSLTIGNTRFLPVTPKQLTMINQLTEWGFPGSQARLGAQFFTQTTREVTMDDVLNYLGEVQEDYWC